MSNWRALEAEIVRIARQNDYDVVDAHSGDKIIVFACNDDPNAHTVDLTEFAKQLDAAGIRIGK